MGWMRLMGEPFTFMTPLPSRQRATAVAFFLRPKTCTYFLPCTQKEERGGRWREREKARTKAMRHVLVCVSVCVCVCVCVTVSTCAVGSLQTPTDKLLPQQRLQTLFTQSNNLCPLLLLPQILFACRPFACSTLTSMMMGCCGWVLGGVLVWLVEARVRRVC